MKVSELDFSYPEALVATSPQPPSRVLLHKGPELQEISVSDLLSLIPAGDVLVLNNTQVLKRRVFAGDIEIVFLNSVGSCQWEVLFPSKKYAIGDVIELPLGVKMKLIKKGRPQTVELNSKIEENYFEQVGELPLPPYIQKARGTRHTVASDQSWYQTAWAQEPGSLAAPTASLHFTKQDIEFLKNKGVQAVELTLHVGLGTFLPVTTENLSEHIMHEEFVSISKSTWQTVLLAKEKNLGVWALGTTVARSLESAALKKLKLNDQGGLAGFTNLLIEPGYKWQIVNRLMTNFHQPQSTLLALVAAFSDLETVKRAYAWAINKKFRLFSYGDLSVWIK